MRRRVTELTDDQRAFVLGVQAMWAEGLTQQDIADRLDKPLSTVRGRLAYYGYRFGRAGRIERIEAPDITEAVA